MTKPRLIILVRHGQSEGNKNRDIHQTIPDHRVKLTPEGWNQAHDAGRRLRNLLRPDDKLHFFTSPYRRTRETTEGILATLTADDPEPSPFRRSSIKVYEEPRLREQDFGNFQPCSAEMERMWQERADYGHFFYRIPNGESAADAYDRISGFNESLWRQFGEDDFASVCVLVTHGLMSRVFLMKWYHFTVEYFEDLRNINHCEFLSMRKEDNGKYILENNLRTWSELRRERASKDRGKDKDKEDGGGKDKDKDKSTTNLARTKTFVVTRRWGGCPNGCNHRSHYVKRDDLEMMRQKDHENGGPQPYGQTGATTTVPSLAPTATSPIVISPGVMVETRIPLHLANGSGNGNGNGNGVARQSEERLAEEVVALEVATRGSNQNGSAQAAELLSTSPEDVQAGVDSLHLHIGRDGGGTYSGHNSAADTDTDASDDEALSLHRVASLNAHLKSLQTDASITNDAAAGGVTNGVNGSADHLGNKLAYAGENGAADQVQRPRTNRLGDASSGSTSDDEMDDLDEQEKNDRSIQGSVY